MQQHELKIDKSTWAPGPWQDEPDRVEWRDAKTGLPCIISRGPSGALCGYVGVAPSHPLHGVGYDAHYDSWDEKMPCPYTPEQIKLMETVSVHGGLTYSRKCEGRVCHVPQPGESDDVWWLGFDCAHCDDLTPAFSEPEFMEKLRGYGSTYRTMFYVKQEVAELAGQLGAMQ